MCGLFFNLCSIYFRLDPFIWREANKAFALDAGQRLFDKIGGRELYQLAEAVRWKNSAGVVRETQIESSHGVNLHLTDSDPHPAQWQQKFGAKVKEQKKCKCSD